VMARLIMWNDNFVPMVADLVVVVVLLVLRIVELVAISHWL